MTEPRKTPRTDAEESKAREDWERFAEVGWPSFPASDYDFARSLEIETQELAEALAGIATITSEPNSAGIASKFLSRHRAKQSEGAGGAK